MSKKRIPVQIESGTAWLAEGDKVSFVAPDLRCYWIDRSSPEFRHFSFSPGQVFWIYHAEGKVIGLVPYADATREELPEAGEHEVEIKIKKRRNYDDEDDF